MYIVLIGPQGSGKGTQADRLVPKHDLMKISTGELFRAEKKAGTELGKLVAGFLDSGELVPDEVTISIVDRQLKAIDDGAARGAVFDGFPRNREQAMALDAAMKARNDEIDLVIEISVQESTLIERLGGRRVCTSCGETFHILYKPPAVAGICDKCGGKLEQRADDTSEAIHRRLAIYRQNTEPLLEYYSELGLVRTVNGDQAMEDVERDIDLIVSASTGKHTE